MILYKYYSLKSGLAALESQQLGFRLPIHFNDPFELSLLNDSAYETDLSGDFKKHVEMLKTHIVILCLSRSFSNPLMWAHYAQSHEGIVIGYNVDHAYLSSKRNNIIPITYGDVIYRNSKPEITDFHEKMSSLDMLITSSLGGYVAYTPQSNKLIRDFFLTKHISWANEEEVRVVKPLYPMLSDQAELYGEFKESDQFKGLYFLNQVADIREVYFGSRFKMHTSEVIEKYPAFKYFSMSIESHSWKLAADRIL